MGLIQNDGSGQEIGWGRHVINLIQIHIQICCVHMIQSQNFVTIPAIQ